MKNKKFSQCHRWIGKKAAPGHAESSKWIVSSPEGGPARGRNCCERTNYCLGVVRPAPIGWVERGWSASDRAPRGMREKAGEGAKRSNSSEEVN